MTKIKRDTSVLASHWSPSPCGFQLIQLEVSQRPPTVMVRDTKQALLSSHDEEEGALLEEGFVAGIALVPQLAQIRVGTKRNNVLT